MEHTLHQGGEFAEEKAKAARNDEACLFMKELRGKFEGVAQIAYRFGYETVSDLMCLQNAILEGKPFEYAEDSVVQQVVIVLPSAERWNSFIKYEREVQEIPTPQ